jgi:23S rRNA (uracil1939-C5)-methyltransferase
MDKPLKVGDVIEVQTERLAYGGDAVARHNGLAIFIPYAAPDERIRVRVVELKRNYARAAIEEILSPSVSRRAALCKHFGDCGGCQLQHLTYEAQLEAKSAFVRDALKRVGKIDWPDEIKVLSASEYGYRSRAQIKIAPVSSAPVNSTPVNSALLNSDPLNSQTISKRNVGFYRAGSRSICDVSDCPALAPELAGALASVRALANRDHLFSLAEVEIAAGDNHAAVEPALDGLPARALEKHAGGVAYSFSPSTFFQGNPLLLEPLIAEAVGGYEGALAIDLYAGVGLFTIQLARRFEKVLGVESDPKAARFARENILANKQTAIEFHSARVEDWLKRYVASAAKTKWPSPDLILLDPPRTGAAEAVSLIAQLKPKHISYVSCDPATLARDMRALLDSGFELERVIAIDLFPQTYHVETVARLRRI